MSVVALHVACLPFPTFQGTQAAIAAMLGASHSAGIETHLLAYEHSAFQHEWPFQVHRIRNVVPVSSLRSGPSLGKLGLDVQVAAKVRGLVAALHPDRIVAHHVEASAALWMARIRPTDFVAHTALESELRSYLPRLPSRILGRCGRLVDLFALREAERLFAVSPALATHLEQIGARRVTYLPTPWTCNSGRVPGDAVTQRQARHQLALHDGPVALYAGNLDRYQGWEDVIEAVAQLAASGSAIQCVVATESDPSPVRSMSASLGIADRVAIRRLNGEVRQRLLHAAADVAIVPRRAPGGLPVKLLEAFARGLPAVTTKRATSGLPVQTACEIVENDSAAGLANGVQRLLANYSVARARASLGLQYIESQHSEERYLASLHGGVGTEHAALSPQRAVA